MKKISVIVTTYNSSKTIRNTIQSILNQEGLHVDFDIELILVDDCSSDETYSILRQYDCKLFQTEKNTGGPNRGRNLGLNAATGDYISIADHDDVWDKNRVKSMLPFLEKEPIVTSGYKVMDARQNKEIFRVNHSTELYTYYGENETFLKRLTKSLKGQNTYLGSIMFHADLKNIQFEEHFGSIDFDWMLRLFHTRSSIEVAQPLYTRFVDVSNLSLNIEYRKLDFYYSLMILEEYEDAYPSEVLLSYKRIHGSRARYHYVTGNMKKARFYFLKSEWNLKTFMYYITSFVGHKYVRRKFNVFG